MLLLAKGKEEHFGLGGSTQGYAGSNVEEKEDLELWQGGWGLSFKETLVLRAGFEQHV